MPKSTLHKSSINNGLFLGVAMVISTYVIYWANPSMFFKARPFILFLIFSLIIAKSGSESKRHNGGYLSYGEGFKNMFITGLIAVFICTVFEYLLFNFIGTELAEIKRELELESMEALVEFLGPTYEEMVEVEIENLEDSNPVGLAKTFQSFIGRIFAPVAITAAIFALFMKNNPPNDLVGKEVKEKPKKYIINK